MTRVVLVNQEKLPLYRVTVYNYLAEYLRKRQYALTVVSEGIPDGNAHPIEFDHRTTRLTFLPLARTLLSLKPDVVIYWVRLRHLYLFPMLFLLLVMRKKIIYWGHGADLSRRQGVGVQFILNAIEYSLSDALILYAQHLRCNVSAVFQKKVFIANNTLHFDGRRSIKNRAECLAGYGIRTTKNIICTGRMQRRKRIEDLVAAFAMMNRPDVGLILVGPDTDGILTNVNGLNIHKLGAIYGDERLDILSAADIFCLPGAVGLSIVDAFYCGLPIVTEDGDESPELMYLKPGLNGFVVPRGDVGELSARLTQLLDDDGLRRRFSDAARREINSAGHIDKMCKGFEEALDFVCAGSVPLAVTE